jgi:hypothetical protein
MTEGAAQAALKAISKMHDEEFNEMQTIATQFMWCSYYFYGTSYEPVSKGKFQYNDFRRNEEYQKFASKYNAELRYIFINNAGYVNLGDFESCCQRLVASVDTLTSLQALDLNALGNVMREFAAIEYFGKSKAFKNYFYEIHHGTKEVYNTLVERYNNYYHQGYTDIQAFTMIPASDFSDMQGGFICSECSWAPESIKQRYNHIKSNYEKHLQELYNILLDSPDLTICYNNASVGNSTINNSSNVSNYVDINQVLQCASELLTNEALGSDNESLLLQIREQVPELLDAKLQEYGYTKNKLIIIIIMLVILFFMTVVSFGFHIVTLKKITDKSNVDI